MPILLDAAPNAKSLWSTTGTFQYVIQIIQSTIILSSQEKGSKSSRNLAIPMMWVHSLQSTRKDHPLMLAIQTRKREEHRATSKGK